MNTTCININENNTSFFYFLIIFNPFRSEGIVFNDKKPFPQHAAYTKGTIKPNHKTQAQLDADVIFVYQRWKKNYLTEDIGEKGQYYIKYQQSGAVTCSEAHGYGMVTLAYMAGADSKARDYFDGMFHFLKLTQVMAIQN
ncbi:hypothetical protein [Pedobacter steynii]